MTAALLSHRYTTPLGELVALFTARGLSLLEFDATIRMMREWRDVERHAGVRAQPGEDARTRELGAQIADYFAGRLRRFDVPLDLVGTPFQQDVWRALLQIPYGDTWSYAQQARHIDRHSAVRAVAAANGQNKISIVVPCHRVIGSNGKLTGYGGGLPRKHWLLTLEQTGAPPASVG